MGFDVFWYNVGLM